MRIVIVYESIFGNTHRIAVAVEQGVRHAATTSLISVSEPAVAALSSADVLVLGGPTHAFSMSTPASRREAVSWAHDPNRHLSLDSAEPISGIREWLDNDVALPPLFATFDTRVASMRHLPGSAARAADKELRSRRLKRLAPPTSFYVSSHNDLLPDEEERARSWGEQLARASVATVSAP